MSRQRRQMVIDMSALALSNVAPMGLVFAVRTFGNSWLGFYVASSVFAIGVLAIFYFFSRYFPEGDTSNPIISKVESLGGEVSGYLASFILPLALIQQPTVQDLLVSGVCLAIYILILIRTNMILINPLLYIAGFRLWRVYSENIPGGNGILISRNEPIVGAECVVRGQNRILLEDRRRND
ncbi:hypothetical protein ACTXJE_01710 [Glutamicibacter ardleyensis]